ncbi:MAG TPA: branched-chain amino acid ABC transporter substrate-binding protein [Chloroflexota bacterium]|nr:branched-chain amino acid ABC transporter substrate-binding protein [Chloroflexota bacterium]
MAKPAASPSASAVAVASPSAAPAAQFAAGTTIKIVSSLPRTGSSKGQTDTIVNSFKMALDEAGNKVNGATITYTDMDDATAAKGAWDAAKEAENANQALNDPDVMVYVGTFNSGAAKVSIPILCKTNLGMISPANTYPGLTKSIPGAVESNEPGVYYEGCQRNYTRVVPSDEIQGAAAANWAKTLGATKAYVLDDTELYGHGLGVVFANTAPKVGLQLVGGPEGIDGKASDYRAVAQKVRASGADVVFFGGITQNNAGKLWQDLRATLDPSVRLMGPDGIYEQAFLDAAGPAAEGSYITFGGVPPSKLTGAGAAWYTKYKQQFNSEPEAYAGYGYEAMKVALDAIGRAGKKDRAAIRDAIFATKNFNGVLGTWSFLDTGDTSITAMSGRQVKSGAFDDANAITLSAPQ